MIAVQLADDSIQKTARRQQIIDGLHDIPSQIKKVLAMDKALQTLAKDLLSDQKSLLIMGRGYQCKLDLPFRRQTQLTDRCHMFRGRSQDQGSFLHAQ